jgi:hypothetical protein
MNATQPALKRPRSRWTIGLLAAGGLLLVVGANAHLLYVAVTSQPDCVPHARAGDGTAKPERFNVAKSAC